MPSALPSTAELAWFLIAVSQALAVEAAWRAGAARDVAAAAVLVVETGLAPEPAGVEVWLHPASKVQSARIASLFMATTVRVVWEFCRSGTPAAA